MARGLDTATFKRGRKKITSIGKSRRTRIKNKHKRRSNGGKSKVR
jgi:hypothetical protein